MRMLLEAKRQRHYMFHCGIQHHALFDLTNVKMTHAQLVDAYRTRSNVPLGRPVGLGACQFDNRLPGFHDPFVFDQELDHCPRSPSCQLEELFHDFDKADHGALLDGIAGPRKLRRSRIRPSIEHSWHWGNDQYCFLI
jgi:hypothetical protein